MGFKILFTACLLVNIFYFNNSSAQVNTEDSIALVDLYNSTGGNNWKDNKNWLTSQPVSLWAGIKEADGHVIQITLSYNNLSGRLPESLGKLSGLQSLAFSNNPITGTIPESIGNLTQLQTLYLDNTQLTGSIPKSIGYLNKLKGIFINYTPLSGPIPESFGNLSSLEDLQIINSDISGSIPAELGKLYNLVSLSLYQNKLSGAIPASLGNLSKLQYLNISVNSLEGQIPPELGNLLSLQLLSFEENKLTGNIPSSLGNLNKLNTLSLTDNKLSGPIPSSFANLTSLVRLWLEHNQLGDSIPASLKSLSSGFQWFFIAYNRFTFSGMEMIAQKDILHKSYTPQATIPLHRQCDGRLWVSVGGTPSNNTFYWYNDGNLEASINGDSSYKPLTTGNYYVKVTNKVVNDLTLYSDSSAGIILKRVNASICEGKSYTLPSGNIVHNAGIYNDTLHGIFDCDSIITIVSLAPGRAVDVTINKINKVICDTQFYVLPSGYAVNTSGVYKDTLPSAGGCDSLITVLTLQVNKPYHVNNNEKLCGNLTKILNAGNGFKTYLWSTGDASPQIAISISGLYTVKATDADGCVVSDTFNVTAVKMPTIKLAKDLFICGNTSATLNTDSSFKKYLWNTGSTDRYLVVNQPGIYWVKVTDSNDCSAADTTTVLQRSCTVDFFIPTSFTPNKDGINDVFKPLLFSAAVVKYKFIIYNRLGEKIFESSNPSSGWDGSFHGAIQNENAFVWLIDYHLANGRQKKQKGTVALLR